MRVDRLLCCRYSSLNWVFGFNGLRVIGKRGISLRDDSFAMTHMQGDPILLMSKEKYDAMIDEKETLRKMAIGLAQHEAGTGISHQKALKKLKALQKKWK